MDASRFRRTLALVFFVGLAPLGLAGIDSNSYIRPGATPTGEDWSLLVRLDNAAVGTPTVTLTPVPTFTVTPTYTAVPPTATFTHTFTPTTIPKKVVSGTVVGAGENAVTTPVTGTQIEVDYAEFSVATASSNGARLHFQATVTAGNMIAGHTDMPAGAAVLYQPAVVIQDGLLKSGARRGGTNDPLYLNLTDAESVDYVIHYREITP
jgi:hypothetical protein